MSVGEYLSNEFVRTYFCPKGWAGVLPDGSVLIDASPKAAFSAEEAEMLARLIRGEEAPDSYETAEVAS